MANKAPLETTLPEYATAALYVAGEEQPLADYQVDLAISLVKVGGTMGADGIPHLQHALALLRQLDAQGRLAPADQPKIAAIETLLGGLKNASAS